MRVHADDPGSEKIEVLLDGKLITRAVEADDAEGWVRVIPEHVILNGDGSIPTEILRGSVAIRAML